MPDFARMTSARLVHKCEPDQRVLAFSSCQTRQRQFRSWQTSLPAQLSLQLQASRTNRNEWLPACTLAKLTVAAPQSHCYVRVTHDRERCKANKSWRIGMKRGFTLIAFVML